MSARDFGSKSALVAIALIFGACGGGEEQCTPGYTAMFTTTSDPLDTDVSDLGIATPECFDFCAAHASTPNAVVYGCSASGTDDVATVSCTYDTLCP